MTNTEVSTPNVEILPVIEVHNCYTLYELNDDGNEVKRPVMSFFRPSDWANPDRWHYHYCKIEVKIDNTIYINHCHIWQEVDRHIIEACQKISKALFMIVRPGGKPELCGNTHLDEEDFWWDAWGKKPPVFIDESDVDCYEDEF